MKTFFAEIMP